MKRLITLLLVLAMCLSLGACAKEEADPLAADKDAFAAANALLEAGDYEGALDAFYSIEVYQLFNNINSKIMEIEEHLSAEKLGFLEGVWMSTGGDWILTFDNSGNFTYQYPQYGSDEIYEGYAWMEGETLMINGEAFTVTEMDGRLSPNLCKPPMWCIIGAPHWR